MPAGERDAQGEGEVYAQCPMQPRRRCRFLHELIQQTLTEYPAIQSACRFEIPPESGVGRCACLGVVRYRTAMFTFVRKAQQEAEDVPIDMVIRRHILAGATRSRSSGRSYRLLQQAVELRPIEEATVGDHRADAPRVAQVGGRVGIEQHEIGNLARFHGAERLLQTE